MDFCFFKDPRKPYTTKTKLSLTDGNGVTDGKSAGAIWGDPSTHGFRWVGIGWEVDLTLEIVYRRQARGTRPRPKTCIF